VRAVRYSATRIGKQHGLPLPVMPSLGRVAVVCLGLTFAKAEFRFTRGTPLEYESSAKSSGTSRYLRVAPSYEHSHDDFVDVTPAVSTRPGVPAEHHSWLSDDIAG